MDNRRFFYLAEGECEATSTDERLDAFDLASAEVGQTATRHAQTQIACLRLAEGEDLLEHARLPVQVVSHDFEVVWLGGVVVAFDFLDRGSDDGERRHHVVCDVGEELQFFVVEFVGLLTFQFHAETLTTCPFAASEITVHQHGHADKQKGIEQ